MTIVDMREVIQHIVDDVKRRFDGESTGHDWWHIYRVWQMAKRIGAEEHADSFVVELAALLHDIADWKFHDGDETAGSREARKILAGYGVDEAAINHVCDIIDNVSFKGAGVPANQKTIEGKVVQDSDRLDAIGAIGIARAFAYGGKKERSLHDPAHAPAEHSTKEAYFNNRSTTLNHFYEKLLLLKDRMNTETGKKIAGGRHSFMERYLEQFYAEWGGDV